MRSSRLWFIGSLGLVVAACDGAPVETDTPCEATYPSAPDGAGEIVYVAGQCPESGALGTAEHPFHTVSAALQKAGDGATLLVAAGHYAENLTISRPVTIVGSSAPDDPESAEMILEAPLDTAVLVSAPGVSLIGIQIVSPRVVGVRVNAGSATISGSRIDSVKVDAQGKFGFGVLATGDSAIILQNSLISASGGAGILAQDSGAIILQSKILDSGANGVRLEHAVGEVKLEGVQILRSKGIGLAALSSRAIILQSEIRDTGFDADGLGDGVLATDIASGGASLGPSDITMKDTTVSGSARAGVLCNGQTRTIILQNNHINDNGSPDLQHATAGIWLQRGAGGELANEISGNEISGNRFVGVHMMGETHGIILQNNVISGTLKGTVFAGVDQVSIGDGVSLKGGASARITGNQIKQNDRFGVIADGAPGAQTEIGANTIVDNGEYGIILQDEADTIATDTNTFSGNGSGDVDTVPAGTYGIAQEELVLE